MSTQTKTKPPKPRPTHGRYRIEARNPLDERPHWLLIREHLGWLGTDKHQHRADAEQELWRMVKARREFEAAGSPWEIRVRCDVPAPDDDDPDRELVYKRGAGKILTPAPAHEATPVPEDAPAAQAKPKAKPKSNKRKRPRRA